MDKLRQWIKNLSMKQFIGLVMIILYSMIYLWFGHNAVKCLGKDLPEQYEGIMNVMLAGGN